MARALKVNDEPIAGYRLTKYLGRGGVGEVWQAEAPGNVSKAVKLIPLDDTEALLKDRELQGLAKIRAIRHPYLLSIDRYELVAGYIAIVMELADSSLADRFEDCASQLGTGIPRAELLRYLRESAEVLDLLSLEHGLQHLDIKPENLFLMSGHVKVADFGLVAPSMTELNRASLAFTPAYAPPELFQGRIAPSADQYSLAVTYQELLTGRRPFLATSFRELAKLHESGQPDLSNLPPGDQAPVARALSKEEADRFPSCGAFVEALLAAGERQALVETRAVSARPTFQPTQVARPHEAVAAPPRSALVPAPLAGVAAKPIALQPAKGPALRSAPKAAPQAPAGPVVVSRRSKDARTTARVVNSFLAFVPVEIYARKLRAFMDELGATFEGAPLPERAVLRFQPRGTSWLRPNRQALLLTVEATRTPRNPDSSVVEVVVESLDSGIDGPELNRRALLLIRAFRSYMMATEHRHNASINPIAIKAELWQPAGR